MKAIAGACLVVMFLLASAGMLFANSSNCTAVMGSTTHTSSIENIASPVSNIKFETNPDAILTPGIQF